MRLSFTADENINSQVVRSLRAAGHAVYHVAEQSAGVSDEQVLQLSIQTDSILITTDKDFGELVFRQRKLIPGVMLLRLHSLSPGERAARVAEIVDRHGAELPGAFTVDTARAVRIRTMY